MTESTHLIPISYHLRNFNKYVKLDLAAAKFGNLTLVGENAAGKTTLANCFFPMLIDGSIATPSFNPTKDTDKVGKVGNARNSRQDTRTFESMLLGWGPSAMKVRTGYSYMIMASTQRKVILGIGAQRTVGASGKTWWFAATVPAENEEIELATTNEDGSSLNFDEFRAANSAFGDQLRVFKTADAYREFVAMTIYGFDNALALSQLANVYRLLASPILSGGNAKFSPIKDALREAQASIDDSVIFAAAETQRDVNRKNHLLKRINQAQKRLETIKRNLFWGNLNHLNELKLKNYATTHADFELEKEKITQYQTQIEKSSRALITLEKEQLDAKNELDRLKEAWLRQKAIKQRRDELEERIKSDKNQVQQFLKLQQQIAEQNEKLQNIQNKLTQLEEQINNINQNELSSLMTQLHSESSRLIQFEKVLAQPSNETLIKQFDIYLKQMKQHVNHYKDLENQAQNLSQDVQIVTDMQGQMSSSIDHHTQGAFAGKIREGLQRDNRSIHETGAGRMNKQYERIKEQQSKLLDLHPDVRVFLNAQETLNALDQQQQQLDQIVQKLSAIEQNKQQAQLQRDNVMEIIKAAENVMEPNFDVDTMRERIKQSENQLKQLVVDELLESKLTNAELLVNDLETQKQDLMYKKNSSQGELNSTQKNAQKYSERLANLNTEIESMIKVLSPYVLDGFELKTTANAIDIVNASGTDVRNHRYSDIADRIRRGIHRNNADGTDPSALDTLFAERGYDEIAQKMVSDSNEISGITTLNFDINQAAAILEQELNRVSQSISELKTGNEMAKETYLTAAVERISDQYSVIESYNKILADGLSNEQGIKLKIELRAREVDPEAIKEACDLFSETRPHLEKVIQERLNVLANDAEVAEDDDLFTQRAMELLDTRQWSEFHVLIKRRQSAINDFEEVDDKFVRSGGSGAEKAQAMVLPLLLVPKMLLQQSAKEDAPYLVMFDEFADKLDPETAKSFAKTIANFGFAFIATMPSGAQNKILADKVDNVAYEVIAPAQKNDDKFHPNQVLPVLRWQKELNA